MSNESQNLDFFQPTIFLLSGTCPGLRDCGPNGDGETVQPAVQPRLWQQEAGGGHGGGADRGGHGQVADGWEEKSDFIKLHTSNRNILDETPDLV